MSTRCSDLSLAAGESLVATATTATRWLLLEMPSPWPGDVSESAALPEEARSTVSRWLDDNPGSRLQFIRRPGEDRGRRLAFVVSGAEGGGEVRRIELASLDELGAVDLRRAGATSAGSLVLVCGHGSRDPCCAARGAAVYRALRDRLAVEELWVSSHQGGHRFAANMLVLPAGLQFGRVEPERAAYVAARALAGRIELDCYRGRTFYEARVQAAEHLVRRRTGLDGIDELRLDAVVPPLVRFRAWTGEQHGVQVDEDEGPPVPPSCGAEPEPQRVFRTRLV